jgi:hypothetical protein
MLGKPAKEQTDLAPAKELAASAAAALTSSSHPDLRGKSVRFKAAVDAGNQDVAARIYWLPYSAELLTSTVSLSPDVALVAEIAIDEEAKRLEQLRAGIEKLKEKADKASAEDKFDIKAYADATEALRKASTSSLND